MPTSIGRAKYLLTTIDVFSKYVALYPIARANTNTAIRKIFENHIPNHGKPKSIITDHGTQFTSAAWRNKLKTEEIKHIFSAVRHPQSNSIERVHRDLSAYLRVLVKENHSAWATHIKTIEKIINETFQETIENTPIEIQKNIKPTRFWKKYVHTSTEEKCHEEKIREAAKKMHKKLKQRALKRNKNIKPQNYEVDDKVLIKACNVSDTLNNKVAKFYSVYEGPYYVKKKISKDTYILWDKKNERGMFHGQDMKPYNEKAEK